MEQCRYNLDVIPVNSFYYTSVSVQYNLDFPKDMCSFVDRFVEKSILYLTRIKEFFGTKSFPMLLRYWYNLETPTHYHFLCSQKEN